MKKNKLFIILFSLIFILILVFPAIYGVKNSLPVIIKTRANRYHRARQYFSIGNYFIGKSADKEYRKKSSALRNKKVGYSFKILTYDKIAYVELLGSEMEKDDQPELNINKKYLGTYKINVSGHVGKLYLYVRGNRVYGTVRFPRWAKGVVEYLKNVRIKGDKLTFTRSVTTRKELIRIGAGRYFVQKFSGDYKKGGKEIKGLFFHKGAHEAWEAYR